MSLRPWNHNIHYHQLVVRSAGPGCKQALDVGCGRGLLARRLAQNCREVIAIDLDHAAIAEARAGGDLEGRIKYVEGDVMTYPFPEDSFELIAAIATLHHLQLRPALARFRKLLRPGGVLAIIGLYRGQTLSDRALAAAAFPVSWVLRAIRGYADVGAPVQNPRETLLEIRNACDLLLPGASLRRHLLFRFSLIWRKPAAESRASFRKLS